jgi:hypothetical protein
MNLLELIAIFGRTNQTARAIYYSNKRTSLKIIAPARMRAPCKLDCLKLKGSLLPLPCPIK